MQKGLCKCLQTIQDYAKRISEKEKLKICTSKKILKKNLKKKNKKMKI